MQHLFIWIAMEMVMIVTFVCLTIIGSASLFLLLLFFGFGGSTFPMAMPLGIEVHIAAVVRRHLVRAILKLEVIHLGLQIGVI